MNGDLPPGVVTEITKRMLGTVWDAQRQLMVDSVEHGVTDISIPLSWEEIPEQAQQLFARHAITSIGVINEVQALLSDRVKKGMN